MEREKFYKIIDQYADDWIVDANSPIKGIYKNQLIKETTGPRRRINGKGEVLPANETNGCVQVLKYKHYNKSCPKCGNKPIQGLVEIINIRSRAVKIDDCGCRLP